MGNIIQNPKPKIKPNLLTLKNQLERSILLQGREWEIVKPYNAAPSDTWSLFHDNIEIRLVLKVDVGEFFLIDFKGILFSAYTEKEVHDLVANHYAAKVLKRFMV